MGIAYRQYYLWSRARATYTVDPASLITRIACVCARVRVSLRVFMLLVLVLLLAGVRVRCWRVRAYRTLLIRLWRADRLVGRARLRCRNYKLYSIASGARRAEHGPSCARVRACVLCTPSAPWYIGSSIYSDTHTHAQVLKKPTDQLCKYRVAFAG